MPSCAIGTRTLLLGLILAFATAVLFYDEVHWVDSVVEVDIRGRIRADPNDEPVAGATILVLLGRTDDPDETIVRTISDANGDFDARAVFPLSGEIGGPIIRRQSWRVASALLIVDASKYRRATLHVDFPEFSRRPSPGNLRKEAGVIRLEQGP